MALTKLLTLGRVCLCEQAKTVKLWVQFNTLGASFGTLKRPQKYSNSAFTFAFYKI